MNLRLILSSLFPEGSFGGECGLFVRNKLAEINPIGDQYSQKQKSVDLHGIRASQLKGDFRIGDVIVTSEGNSFASGLVGKNYGHVAFVNNIVGDLLYLTESNYKKNKLITHGRNLSKNSNKIYGVIRRPFKFKVFNKPLQFDICVLLNQENNWKENSIFELGQWIDNASGGNLKCNFYPLNTYKALKNWWYSIERSDFGGEYKVIDKQYILNQVKPLGFASNNKPANFILWCITNKQWEGAAFEQTGMQLSEYGWFYRNTNIATIACSENDISFKYSHLRAYVHYGAHEILHFLENYGNRRNLSLTDIYDANGNLADVFKNIEWDYLAANI